MEREGTCRRCGTDYLLEAAHTIGREHDRPKAAATGGSTALYVDPDSIVPLCRECHRAYDAHEIDLLGHLTVAEELDAVKRAGGLELARVRLCPTAYKEVTAVCRT